jgi:hypothetical protein
VMELFAFMPDQYCPVNLELLVRKPIAARLSG